VVYTFGLGSFLIYSTNLRLKTFVVVVVVVVCADWTDQGLKFEKLGAKICNIIIIILIRISYILLIVV
jgi:hypothetical protein